MRTVKDVSIPIPGTGKHVNLNPIHYIKEANPAKLAFGWVRDQIKDLFTGTDTLIEKMVAHTPLINHGGWETYLYGNSITFALALSGVVTIVIACITTIVHKRLPSLMESFAIMSILSFGSPMWFATVDWILRTSNDAVNEIMKFSNRVGGSGSTTGLITAPSISNILGAIFGLGLIAMFGSMLILIFFIYSILMPIATFTMLVAWALSPIGERSRKLLNVIISIAIVTLFAGRIAAVTCLEISKVAINNVEGGDTAFGETAFIIGGIIAAIIAQPVLFAIAYVNVNKVTGNIRALSKVTGNVETVTRQKLQADINHSQEIEVMAALTGAGTMLYKAGRKVSAVSKASETRGGPVRSGATAAATRAAAGASSGGAAPVAAAVVTQVVGSRRGRDIKGPDRRGR